jgi:hypothetical protein
MYDSCTVHCDIFMQLKPTKYILFKIDTLVQFFLNLCRLYMFRTSWVYPQGLAVCVETRVACSIQTGARQGQHV